MTYEAEHVSSVVVGGAQAGLATGYHLRQRDMPFVILDRGERVGDSWRNRWDSLRLFTPARYSGLPGMPFPAPLLHYPTKDEMADYLGAYASTLDLPVELGVEVERVKSDGDRFEVIAANRSFVADNVVIASGDAFHPRIPAFASGLDREIVQLHAKDYRRPSQLQSGGVLVVGAGNSGAEIAIELSRYQRTWLAGRHPGQEPTRAGTLADRVVLPLMWFAATRVLTVRTPLGRKVRSRFLDPPRGIPLGRVRKKDYVAAGIERVPRMAGVHRGNPLLEDGQVLEVANVVWCTGFTSGFDSIELPLDIGNGAPFHDRGIVASCPGLYFVGLTFQYSLSSSLVGGVGRDAERVVDHIVASRRGPNAKA